MASLFKEIQKTTSIKYSITHQWDQLKLSAFCLFHLSLNNVKRSSWDIFILSTFDGLQCLSYSFLLSFDHTWTIQEYTAIHYYLNKFFKIFLFTPYLIESSYHMFLVAYFGSIIFTLAILGLFFYLIYLIQNNTVLSKWHIYIYDVIARYFSGLFFIPILRAILPLLYCEKFIMNYSSIYEKDITYCSSVEAIVYLLLSSISLAIAIAFAFLFSAFHFDIRMSKANYMSRLSPKYDLMMVICKVIVPFSFEFVDLSRNENKIILAFLLMIVSIWLYYILETHILFYSLLTQKTYQVMILILSATNSALFIDLVLLYFGFVNFDGFFELWCLTILFIILFHLFSTENYAKALSVGLHDTVTPNQAIKGIMALLRVINKRESNIEYEMILKGYIIKHISICHNPECSIKRYQQNNSYLEYTAQEQNILVQHMNDLFVNYLVLFPSDISLRIIYSLFALEVLGKINSCRINMMAALNLKPSFQQEFCLYRMNKIIEDDYLNINDDSVNLHIASTIVFDQYFLKFQETIKLIGLKYLEFWNIFVQEETNMKKIKLIGNTILNLIQIVFNLWEKLQEINPNDYDCLRLYGQFQIDILNDKQLGDLYLIQSKEIILTSGRQIKLFKNDLNHLCFDGSPVLISSQVVNQGLVISQVTNSFIRLFQYQKIELIGKDINILLPIELREYHTRAVKEFLKQSQNKKAIEKKEIRGFALNKTGYIFPIQFSMIFLPNLTKEANIAIRVKPNKKITHYICHIMINTALDIINISSQSIKFLNIAEKGIWSIKNSKKIKPENRINIRYLIKEVNSLFSSTIQPRQYPFTEKLSHKGLPMITHQGWKDHKILKSFIEEKNSLVHLYDFQQVYHVSFNDKHNTKDPYVTTMLASQIEKNISFWNKSIREEVKGMGMNKNDTQSISSHMKIFDITFSQLPVGYYIIALDYVYQEMNEKGKVTLLHSFKNLSTFNLKTTGFLNKMTNLSECKFKKNKIIEFDLDTGVFKIKEKEKGKSSTLVSILSQTNIKNAYYNHPNINTSNDIIDRESSSSLSISLSHEKRDDSFQSKLHKPNIETITKHEGLTQPQSRHQIKIEGGGDVYNSLFFQDYSDTVLYYDLDPNTLTCSIFAKPTPKEGKSLAELTHFFENDTLKTDDDISNIKNNEDNDFNKAKYEINKNYFLKLNINKTERATLKHVILSWIIIIIHFSLSICALVFYDSYLTKTKNNILCMNRISSLLNYSLSSNSYYVDTFTYQYLPSITMNELIAFHFNATKKLLWNAKKMYDALAITDLFFDDTFTEINSIHSKNITMIVLIDINEDTNTPLTSENNLPFNEAVNYLMAAIYSLGSDPNINTNYFNSNGFFLCFNSINNYYLNTMDYLGRIKTIVIETRDPNTNQLAIIYSSISVNIVLLFILYLWISFMVRTMNKIILEFLSIKQVEALFITKKIEKFIKNIRINDLEAEEEEKEDDLEVRDKKRNNSYIVDKMRRIQSEEITIIIILIILFIFLLLDFLIQYLLINSYNNDSNHLVELFYTLNEFIGNMNLISIGIKIRLFADKDITMLNEPIDIMINKQFDLFVVLKERLVHDIQLNGLSSNNFTSVYNNDIALDQLPFKPSLIKPYLDSLTELSFDYALAYYYNTLLSFYSFSLSVTKEEALKDLRILYSNAIKDDVLGPYLSLISKAAIADCVNTASTMLSFVFTWFWVWVILLGIVFFCIWIPLIARLEREVSSSIHIIIII